MSAASQEHDQDWQAEADLLADGRELLERWSDSLRYRHLYPDGPNLSLLLEAYQELDRRRAVGRMFRFGRRRDYRELRRLLRRSLRRDVLARNRHLQWHVPNPTPRPLVAPRPDLVELALSRVDWDIRDKVADGVEGRSRLDTSDPAVRRGLNQFRDALTNVALAHPQAIGQLHPQYVLHARADLPTRRRHPVANLLLVKLPLYLWMSVLMVLCTAYMGAYLFFNDRVLGSFLTGTISGLLDGQLVLTDVHWRPRLIVDLLTGTPSPVRVREVEVWGPHKLDGVEKTQQSAYAEELEVELVLHEIIPWNRIGIPAVFDIPWVLHFTEAHSEDRVWFHVQEYEYAKPDGEARRVISLIDAFGLLDDSPTGHKTLGFAVDDLRFDQVSLDLDFREYGGWGTAVDIETFWGRLNFDGKGPDDPPFIKLPFAFELTGQDAGGTVDIDDLEIPVEGFSLQRFACGTAGAPLSELQFAGEGIAAGSPVTLEGALLDTFTRAQNANVLTGVDLLAKTPSPGPLVAHVVEYLELAPGTVDAAQATLVARVDGAMTDPRYHVAAEGLTLDALEEPAWAIDDLAVSVSMHESPVPAALAQHYAPAERRQIYTFDTLRGTGLDGTIAMRGGRVPTRAVMPAAGTDEPYHLSAGLELDAINPAQLFPDDPETGAMFRGEASGRVDVADLVLQTRPGPDGEETALPHADLAFTGFRLVRDRGPEVDGLPRRIRIDGGLTTDEKTGTRAQGLQIATDGGNLSADGGLDATGKNLVATALGVEIDDGAAFMGALGLDPYFDRLSAAMTVAGSTNLPRGSEGRLSLGAGAGRQLGPMNVDSARMWMERGILHIRDDNVTLMGGRGSVEAEVVLFRKGRGLLSDPEIRAVVDLNGVSVEKVLGPQLQGLADLRLEIDDGSGGPVALSQWSARGGVYVPVLKLAGNRYHDTTATFSLTEDEILVHRLRAELHRAVSPFFAPDATAPVGHLEAQGSIGFGDDPALALELTASGIPLGVVATSAGVEGPLRGRIDEGTFLRVGGTLARPRVEGTVAIADASASGIALGDGQFRIDSFDADADAPLVAHREVRVAGEFKDDASAGSMAWAVDAVLAFGAKDRKGRAPMAADFDVRSAMLPLETLLRSPTDTEPTVLVGGLEGISAGVAWCPPGPPMLSACMGSKGTETDLEIRFELDRAWARARSAQVEGDPCADPAALCSENRLVATLDWPMLEVPTPWRWSAGVRPDEYLEFSGSLDLSDDDAPPSIDLTSGPAKRACIPAGEPSSSGQGSASVAGNVSLDTLEPILAAVGINESHGDLGVDVQIAGRVSDPRLAGSIKLLPGQETVILGIGDASLGLDRVEFPDLALDLHDGAIFATGRARVQGESFAFGTPDLGPTFFATSGPCSGSFGLAAGGALSGKLLGQAMGSSLNSATGSIAVDHVRVLGHMEGMSSFETIDAKLSLGERALSVEPAEGLERLEARRGELGLRFCASPDSCRGLGIEPGSLTLFVGVPTPSTPPNPPEQAVRVKVGDRGGEALLWGYARIAPDLETVEDTDLSLQLSQVPYRGYDVRGRPEMELELTSQRIQLRGSDPMIVSGALALERSRWVKDLTGGELLSAYDEEDLAQSAPPPIVRALQFDLDVRTVSPLRVENDIATGVEANLTMDVGGTYQDPEFLGRVDFEAGGSVTIPFLSGTYELQRGRIRMERDLGDASIDVLALRREPVYIDNQAKFVQLLLGGTLRAITPSCGIAGESSGRGSTRDCVDYLVLGSADVKDEANIRRPGANSGLAGARSPMQVVSHVATLDVTSVIDEQNPRWGAVLPDVTLRLGQIGPEIEVATPRDWFDFDYGYGTVGWDYTRGYPGSLLRTNRDLSLKLQILDPFSAQLSQSNRSYLNERIVFDPLRQVTLELRFDFQIPSLR